MKIESDRASVWGGHPPRPHPGQPGRAADREPRPRELGRSDEPVAGGGTPVEEVHLPRPGHADLAGVLKFGHTDVRNVLERASARETAARVAAGALAKVFLRELGVSVHSHVVRIGGVVAPAGRAGRAGRLRGRGRVARALPRRGREHRDGGRDRPRPQGKRESRRRVRGACIRRPARARLACVVGRAPRRAPRLRADVDPRDEGGRDRRRVRPRRARRLEGPRRDLLERRARLRARDEPRRRHRGRDDDRRHRWSRGSR